MTNGVSRRLFLKGMAAIGATAAFVKGFESESDAQVYANGELPAGPEQIYWATGVHNCGTAIRCASKLHVINGRLVRITSDDDDMDFEGRPRDKNNYNDSRALACTKCKSYKYRIYHAGRIKYPLKQTKQRGDVTGFVRVKSEEALNEVARKYRAILSKYGAGAIYNTYATAASYAGKFSDPADARAALTTYIGGTRGEYYDYSYHQNDYAYLITGHPGALDLYGYDTNVASALPTIAGSAKNVVSWGSNILTTNNSVAYPYIRSVEMMKARDPKAKFYHISPEFVDTGVTLATDWVQVRNYTDTALIMAMMHEMIVKTFDENGNVAAKPMLDLNYIDTFVHGFFDSPEYWVNEKTGEIAFAQNSASRKINAVPAGMSLSAYIMGDDTRLQKAKYSAADNYTAQKFSTKFPTRNMSGCAITVKGVPAYRVSEVESDFFYKQDLMKPKTPEWAESICGTPAATIRKLAAMYCDPAQHPIVNEWSGGFGKQDSGVVNIWALQSLMCLTKTFGISGESLYGAWGWEGSAHPKPGRPAKEYLNPENAVPAGRPAPADWKAAVPAISCKEWYNAMKVGFMDTLEAGGYTGKYIPNWDKKDRCVYDDAGAKTSVLYKRNADGSLKTFMDNGKEYYDYVGREQGKPVYVGTRMIVIAGGGIQGNQHFNLNDLNDMYRALPIAAKNPDDPDTFCLVTFDNFLTPTARVADYVLPSTVSLEAGDWREIGGQMIYRPPVVQAAGEVKDGWRYAFEAYQEQAKLGDFTTSGADGYNFTRKVEKDAHFKYVGTDKTTKQYQSAEVLSDRIVEEAVKNKASRFYGMTKGQVYDKQYVARANEEPEIVRTPVKSPLRTNLDNYLSNASTRKNKPFVFNTADYASANTAIAAGESAGATPADIAGGHAGRPLPCGKLQIYNDMIVWDYENKFSKYHGWLPTEKRGQKNADHEGDKIVLPIPIYWDFEDCFNEAYGAFIQKSAPITDGLTLSTTHDRYRVHSSLAENPFLRELNHRTKGGKWASANDWNEFAVMPEKQDMGKTADIPAMLSAAILKKNAKTASWQEIWLNSEDAEERGITDGDLVMAENPIGKIRAVARVSTRCVRGHANLHQGSWYDPNPADGVDDGGCANTLMSCRPSRYDNGNSQQMALVRVSKVQA